jgi:RNA polymerase sigma-70 factor (ECF subfamily)
MVSGPEQWSERQWLAVFSHELAHLRRRDHFAAILAEVTCALLWWQPLAWWSRARLNELSDEACDRWVVASGQAPDVYAEILLGMIPQWRSLTALSMVSGKRGLKKRVAAILNATPAPPDTGRWWVIANTVAASCFVFVAACMQTQAPPETPAANSAATLALANSSMEAGSTEPDSWTRGAAVDGVEYVWDRAVAKTGSASLCLRKTAQRYFPIAQWTQTLSIGAADRPHRYRLSGWVKTEQAYKAILDLQYTNAQGEWRHEWAAYIGARNDGDPPANHDWRQYSGEVNVPAGATEVAVGLQVYGPGTVWFDDIELVPVDTSPSSKTQARREDRGQS